MIKPHGENLNYDLWQNSPGLLGSRELDYIEGFIKAPETTDMFRTFREELAFGEEHLMIAGQAVLAPRLVAWYGDPTAAYQYSGNLHQPLPWTFALLNLKERIEHHCGGKFNSVLCNLYRNGRDSMGWHSDDEKELGSKPLIASISLGDERIFEIRHKKTGSSIKLKLRNGSLLMMGGMLQKDWRHRLPKTPESDKERINLTFRMVYPK
jgi:alkylated DNA repair dioxygenase AlkB